MKQEYCIKEGLKDTDMQSCTQAHRMYAHYKWAHTHTHRGKKVQVMTK